MGATALVITYNHASFIEAAIESVLMQETTVDFEVLVSEDCSTDGTREIVMRLAESHPDRIRMLLSDRNLNDNSVIRRGLEAARGPYVALLDGDDLWTSKHKLQRQVDYMAHHPECAVCFHNATVAYENGVTTRHPFHEDQPSHRLSSPRPKPVSTLADVIRTNFIPTCSAAVRPEAVLPLPEWYDGLDYGDWPLYVLAAQHGELAYLDELMALYRVHPGGLWTMNHSFFSRLEDVERTARVHQVLNRHLGLVFDGVVSERVANLYESAAIDAYRAGKYRLASVCGWRSLKRLRALPWDKRWQPAAVLVLSGLRASARALRKRYGSLAVSA